ncbi:MAG: YIP1 family protein [Candidatus Micrarchaeaceae archaeon]
MNRNNPFVKGIRSIFHPGKETAVSLDIWGSLKIYYSIAIISIVLTAIAIGIMSALGIYSSGISPLSNGLFSMLRAGIPIISIVSAAIGIFIVIPILVFISAIIYQLIGKNFLNAWKGSYEKTFAAVMFGVLPVILFYWAVSIPIIGIFFAFIFGIWELVVLTIALSSQHKIERTKSVIVILVSTIFSIMLVVLVMVFFAIGMFGAIAPYAIPSSASAIYPSNLSIISGGAGLP